MKRRSVATERCRPERVCRSTSQNNGLTTQKWRRLEKFSLNHIPLRDVVNAVIDSTRLTKPDQPDSASTNQPDSPTVDQPDSPCVDLPDSECMDLPD